MSEKKKNEVRIPPGTYTLATLPPLSSGAKRILDELEAETMGTKASSKKLCEVCGQPFTHGAHKHFMQFCKICNKRTKWVTPFFGYPFHCSDPNHREP